MAARCQVCGSRDGSRFACPKLGGTVLCRGCCIVKKGGHTCAWWALCNATDLGKWEWRGQHRYPAERLAVRVGGGAAREGEGGDQVSWPASCGGDGMGSPRSRKGAGLGANQGAGVWGGTWSLVTCDYPVGATCDLGGTAVARRRAAVRVRGPLEGKEEGLEGPTSGEAGI